MEAVNRDSGLSLRRIFGLSSIYGITPILDRALGLLLLPVYTHYLDTTQYGSMVLFYTFAFIVRLAAFMGFPDSLQKMVWDYQGQELKRFLGSVWLFNLGANVVMLSALAAFSRPVSLFLLKNSGLWLLTVLVVVNVFLATQSIIPYVLFRAREQKKQILAYNLTSVLVRVGATLLFLMVFRWGLVGVFLADIAASLAVLMFCLPSVLQNVKPNFDLSYVNKIFKLSAFQLLIELFAWVLSLSDRVLIQKLLHSTSEVGIYTVSYTFGGAVFFLVNPLLAAWRPYVYMVNAKSTKEYLHQMAEFFPVFLIACAAALTILLAASPDLIRILTPEQYHRSRSLVLIIIIGHICAALSNYFLPTFFVKQKLYMVSLAYAVSAGINITANFIFLPKLGIAGSAWATLAAYSTLLALIFFFSQGVLALRLRYDKIAAVVIAVAAVALVIYNIYAAKPIVSLVLRVGALIPIFGAAFFYLYFKKKPLKQSQ